MRQGSILTRYAVDEKSLAGYRGHLIVAARYSRQRLGARFRLTVAVL